MLYGPCTRVKRVALDPLPVVDGAVVFDLSGPGREAFLQNFLGGPRSLLGKAWVVATVPGLSENGNGGKRERPENGSARREPASVRDGSPDGADRSSIFDEMLDFYPSDGLHDTPTATTAPPGYQKTRTKTSSRGIASSGRLRADVYNEQVWRLGL